MYNYNSLRGAVDETARYAIVQFQKEERDDEQALDTKARKSFCRTRSTSAPI